MGRPSKLSEAQWDDVERRLLAGEKRDDLAREYRISGPAITQRLSKSKKLVTVKSVANQLVSAESALRKLPPKDQLLALDVADRMKAMTANTVGAADNGMSISLHLSDIARQQAKQIKGPLTEANIEKLKHVAALMKTANESGSMAMGLLAANRDAAKRLSEAEPEDPNAKPLPLDPEQAAIAYRELMG